MHLFLIQNLQLLIFDMNGKEFPVNLDFFNVFFYEVIEVDHI